MYTSAFVTIELSELTSVSVRAELLGELMVDGPNGPSVMIDNSIADFFLPVSYEISTAPCKRHEILLHKMQVLASRFNTFRKKTFSHNDNYVSIPHKVSRDLKMIHTAITAVPWREVSMVFLNQKTEMVQVFRHRPRYNYPYTMYKFKCPNEHHDEFFMETTSAAPIRFPLLADKDIFDIDVPSSLNKAFTDFFAT